MNEQEQYLQINTGDPGGDIASAYATMSLETDDTTRPLTGNDLRIWAAMNAADYTNIKAASTQSVPAEMALALMQNPDSVLDLGKAEVAGLIAALNQADVISSNGKLALETMATVSTPKYQNLTETRIQNARDMKAKGLI